MVFSRRRGVCGSFLKKNSDCFLVFALFRCGDGFGGGLVLVGVTTYAPGGDGNFGGYNVVIYVKELQPTLREEMEISIVI